MAEPTDPAQLPQLSYADLPMAADRGQGWAALRGKGPVLHSDGVYYLTRREDVLHALRDTTLFSSQLAFDAMISPVPMVPIALDPPDHTRYRRILHPFFSSQALTSILPSLQTQAGDIVAQIATRDECEVMAELATPYPSQVFLTLFGLPLEDCPRLIAWKDAIIALGLATDPGNLDLTPAAELFDYLTEAVAAQRRNPRDGILSQLLTGDQVLGDAEAIGLSIVFVLAGLDTVTSAIGAAMLELARRHTLRTHLHTHPDQVPRFIEEIIRLEPPAPVIGRVTTDTVTVSGVTIPPGTEVRLCLAAINRDGTDPLSGDELVMDGKFHKHWGFGGGPHRCLGAHLARIELNLAITQWLNHIPDFELAPGYHPEIIWPAVTSTLVQLPVTIHH